MKSGLFRFPSMTYLHTFLTDIILNISLHTQPNSMKQTANCSHFNVLYNPFISRQVFFEVTMSLTLMEHNKMENNKMAHLTTC
jgi:hypothetical protein